ncbi:unnamed protein product [Phytophthora fragariaefolia]|uniref:Unnamed protein product n=1 Tax=Phytophthora fragariaefolia TaxID=1490495 RepID=A0A9W6XQ56_9STRA|nr:unnamed protein product [Phytophthora fragariaefolia]
MASRPLPAGRLDGARSPVRQNVALRWLNSVSPAPAAKPMPSPAKKWPPPARVEPPLHSQAAVTPSPAPVTEKKVTESAFQSARALFEAKKTPVTPPLPSHRPSTFHTPAGPIVAKQHSNESDLSNSSCRTVDSESDQKLEEWVETQPQLKLSTPVKNTEKEVVSAAASLCATKPQASYPIREIKATQCLSSAYILTSPKHNQPMRAEIDPFRLLLPIVTVPTLPDEVPYVYDSDAVEMEKNIKKVVRKLLNKDKARLEEFKMNSRLFGTDFMDSHAYLNTLIKYFGPIRALQLVPCLLSVQPDILKRNALLLSAKNYAMRNKETLSQELRHLQPANIHVKGMRESNATGNAATPTPGAADSQSVYPGAEGSVKSAPPPVVTPAPKAKTVVSPDAHTTQRTSWNSITQPVEVAAVKNVTSRVVKPLDSAVPVSPVAQKKPTATKSVINMATATTKVIKFAEPVPEPQEATPPVINIAVTGPRHVQSNVIAMKRVKPVTLSDSEEEFRVDNLFGETINSTPPQNEQIYLEGNLKTLAVPLSPASSTQSYEEAESLFGERLSSPSRSSIRRRKTVTWGESKTVELPTERDSTTTTTEKPLPFLFGPATAAAFDSDSDESDLND